MSASSTLSGFTGGPVRTGLLPDWLNPINILNPTLGVWVIVIACAIIFAETGLLIGFFLPGDSLLFTAGLLTAAGKLPINIWVLALLLIICAIVGNQVGYLIGKKAGPAIFKRPDSRFFKQENIAKAHAFFEKHGGKALVLARFVPIVRTFVPVIVGVAQMDRKKFFLFNVIGGVLWAGGVTLLGFILGDRFPWVTANLDLIFVIIVLISVVPILIEVIRGWRASKKKKQA
nr:VTT domain-containing protein [Renibacterium salmoninarum]